MINSKLKLRKYWVEELALEHLGDRAYLDETVVYSRLTSRDTFDMLFEAAKAQSIAN